MKKRLLSLLVVLAMVFTLIPTTTRAEEGIYEDVLYIGGVRLLPYQYLASNSLNPVYETPSGGYLFYEGKGSLVLDNYQFNIGDNHLTSNGQFIEFNAGNLAVVFYGENKMNYTGTKYTEVAAFGKTGSIYFYGFEESFYKGAFCDTEHGVVLNGGTYEFTGGSKQAKISVNITNARVSGLECETSYFAVLNNSTVNTEKTITVSDTWKIHNSAFKGIVEAKSTVVGGENVKNPIILDFSKITTGLMYDLDKDPNLLNGVEFDIENAKNYNYFDIKSSDCTEHIWGEGLITRIATCKAAGEETFTCQVCGATKVEYTEKIPHDYTVNFATCTQPKKCAYCQETSGSPLGHKFSTGYFVDKAATVSADGLKSRHCTRGDCNAIKDKKVIPKIASHKLLYTTTVYNGNVKNPSLNAYDSKGNKLVAGEDYKITYSTGRKAVGRYTATVKYRGEYSGSKTFYFTIVPKAVSYACLDQHTTGYDDLIFIWEGSKGATGYLVSYKKGNGSWSNPVAIKNTQYVKKDLADGAKYTFKVIPYYNEKNKTTKYYSSAQYYTDSTYTMRKADPPKISRGKNNVKVTVNDFDNTFKRFEVSKSTSKTKTNVVSVTRGGFHYLNAKKGVTYYYKVRAYKSVDGKKVYAPWSKVVAFKR